MRSATAVARPNIALIKYWGKRDDARKLPATGSLAFTLSAFRTTTHVTFDPALADDELLLNGRPALEAERERAARFLDLFRTAASCPLKAKVESVNNFPTASGLASSASGFAALGLAAAKALNLDPNGIEDLVRQGSGSAPRSLRGGLSAYLPDGDDMRLKTLVQPGGWDLRLVLAAADEARKSVSSGDGMKRTRETSPYYPTWLHDNAGLLETGLAAVRNRDFRALGEAAEASSFRMHAAMLAARPALIYWKPATLAVLDRLFALRAAGLEAYASIDAGPHVKVLCRAADATTLATALAEVPGIGRTLVDSMGPGAEVIE